MRRLTICSLLLLAVGCEQSKFGTVDVSTDVPVVRSPLITPDSIYVDSLTPENGRYTINTLVSVKAFSAEGLPTVTATVLRPTGTTVVAEATLRDDGILPDQSARDSVYTGRIQFSVERSLVGRYRVRFAATNSAGAVSNALERALKLGRRNSPPTLSRLNAPDTLVLPPGDSLLIGMNITAADSDGIGDIREVFFRSLDSSDPNRKFFLRDDGGADRSSPSGDERAGDGIYSIIVKLVDAPNVRRTFRFAFQAQDSFNDTSRTVLHYLTIR